ncbi:hypothetical protein EXIGLDRAFT_177064 [Exidia glandulosa HHB12029]|uniref:Uncharacterized protein n=1 Tax=Exidia glandulosa HHB12029 TaxID=1314781 RepID=A0A166BDM4_EXIGL|nr:hypothetical protein EXIGLDRAFT_177064 [Exidia glandulosa HHB12029]
MLPHPPGLFPRAKALEIGGSSLLAVEDGGPGADGSWNAIESYTLHGRAVWWHVNSLGGRGRSVTYYDWDLNVLHNVQPASRWTTQLRCRRDAMAFPRREIRKYYQRLQALLPQRGRRVDCS